MPLFQQVMSENELKALLATVKTERSLVQKLKTAQDAHAIHEIAHQAGFTLSEDEATWLQSELTEAGLEMLSGGTLTAGVGCTAGLPGGPFTSEHVC
jgi:predicted ribosomally synthesized peptide with nif11-like leader